jgi:hypothetical protein
MANKAKVKKTKAIVTVRKETPAERALAKAPQVGSVDALLSQAVAAGADIGTLERLMALRKDMLAEEAKKAFNKAMAEFQSECPVINKTKTVKTKGGDDAYKYAPIDSIVDQVKKLIQKHGFRYSTTMELNGDLVKAFCRVVHELGHEEVSVMEVPLGAQTAVMSKSQVVAAAQTFAKRYAFLNAFGIMTGDTDNDAAKVKEPADDETVIELLNKCKTMEEYKVVQTDIVGMKYKINDMDTVRDAAASALNRLNPAKKNVVDAKVVDPKEPTEEEKKAIREQEKRDYEASLK